MNALQASCAAIDTFIDALWIEDGLSANTLAAYRRDLTLYSQWLADAQERGLDKSTEATLREYAVLRHAGSKATSTNRRLTVFKRYFRWAVREQRLSTDPTLKLLAAKQPLRVPKTLSEAQVETLLGAPDVDTPLGLRDRTMLELMYASGLRVSELVTLKAVHLGLTEGALRVTGKGAKERPAFEDPSLDEGVADVQNQSECHVSTFKLISTAFTEWVSAPIEIPFTPVAAYAATLSFSMSMLVIPETHASIRSSAHTALRRA